jgi:hypothetical protein
MKHSDLARGVGILDLNANLLTQHGIALNGGFGILAGVDIEIGRGTREALVKLLPLPQPSLRARTNARTNPSAQRATQLRSVLARV